MRVPFQGTGWNATNDQIVVRVRVTVAVAFADAYRIFGLEDRCPGLIQLARREAWH
jgi:hypothetical protein